MTKFKLEMSILVNCRRPLSLHPLHHVVLPLHRHLVRLSYLGLVLYSDTTGTPNGPSVDPLTENGLGTLT